MPLRRVYNVSWERTFHVSGYLASCRPYQTSQATARHLPFCSLALALPWRSPEPYCWNVGARRSTTAASTFHNSRARCFHASNDDELDLPGPDAQARNHPRHAGCGPSTLQPLCPVRLRGFDSLGREASHHPEHTVSPSFRASSTLACPPCLPSVLYCKACIGASSLWHSCAGWRWAAAPMQAVDAPVTLISAYIAPLLNSGSVL